MCVYGGKGKDMEQGNIKWRKTARREYLGTPKKNVGRTSCNVSPSEPCDGRAKSTHHYQFRAKLQS